MAEFDLQVCDTLKHLPRVPDESVDLIITDPPYESLNKWREIGTTTRLGGHVDEEKRDESQWFQTISNEHVPWLLQEFCRILIPNRHCYLMCDWPTLQVIVRSDALEEWDYVKPLVWNKVNIGMGYHYRATYEFILFLEKGKRKLSNLGLPDVITMPRLMGNKKQPAEKPVGLTDLLVNQSSMRTETVFDPFVGSGTTVVSAVANGRVGIGWDIDPAQIEFARARVKALGL